MDMDAHSSAGRTQSNHFGCLKVDPSAHLLAVGEGVKEISFHKPLLRRNSQNGREYLNHSLRVHSVIYQIWYIRYLNQL
jgi:hypothetical protein